VAAHGDTTPIFAALLLLILWLPLPWGSHLPWAGPLVGCAAWGLVALWVLLAALGRTRLPEARRLLWPLLLWLAWIGWIGWQLLPQDAATLKTMAPSAPAVHQAVAAMGGMPRDTLSIAPGITTDALLLTLAYCGLYWLVVLTTCDRESRMRWVLGAIVFAGFAEALYGSLMVLSGAEYGFLAAKQYYRGVATGTFVNRNHLAGYLELASAAGIGLILADLRHRDEPFSLAGFLRRQIDLLFSNKMRVRAALAVVVIGVVLTRSRMGNIALFGSMSLCGFLFVLLRERALAGRAAILFLSLMVVDLFIVSRWFGLEAVVNRIEQTDVLHEERMNVLDRIPATLDYYGTAGSGLGTFAVAFAPFRTSQMYGFYDHAHNDYAEFAVEVGFIGLGIILVFAGAHLLHAVRVILARRRHAPAAICFAAAMGLLALGIHAVADFNLQIPANAATLIVLMALAAACPVQSRRQKIP
jgi:O-antigen ligase